MNLSNSLQINAPAEHVWQVVAHEFANISLWASGVPKSSINGAADVPDGASVGGRTCDVPGFGAVQETFIAYDEGAKTFTYAAEGGPFFMKSAHNSWRVKAIGDNKTEVSFSAQLELMPIFKMLMGWLLKRQLTAIVNDTTEELKYYIEEGKPHPRKVAKAAT